MIIHIGWSLGWKAIMDLVDTGLAPNQISEIKKRIESVEGVCTLHDLRSRKMGADALVDVHILVNPRISVSEGHQIGEMVRARVVKEYDDIADVLVHIDPEDDVNAKSNLNLPLRHEIMARLHCDAIEDITLHYLSGKVSVDIYLPLSDIKEAQGFSTLLADDPMIHAIQVYYSSNPNIP